MLGLAIDVCKETLENLHDIGPSGVKCKDCGVNLLIDTHAEECIGFKAVTFLKEHYKEELMKDNTTAFIDTEVEGQQEVMVVISGMVITLSKTSSTEINIKTESVGGDQKILITPSEDKKTLNVALETKRPIFTVVK